METELNGFDLFWSIYPRRVAKQAAARAYKAALKRTTPERILAAAKRYAGERLGQDMTFTKHPSTWLNGGCYCDYEWAAERMTVNAAIEKYMPGQVYVPFEKRDAWDEYGRSIGKAYPRDRHGGWWFPSAEPPRRSPK